MQTFRLTLEGLLKKPVVWFRDHGSRFYRCIYLGEELILSEDDLAQLDVRLQTAIDYALPRNTAPVAGGLIQLTVNSWYNPDESRWTEHKGQLYYMGRIQSIFQHQLEQKTFLLSARTHLGKNVDGVMVLTGQEYSRDQERDYSWLEKYYSGGTKRLWSGEELGLSGADLANYVFYKTNNDTIRVDLPDDMAF